MKHILLYFAIIAFLKSNSFGQDYTVTKNLPITELTGSPNALSLTPNSTSSILPIGFDFNFYGNTYNQFYINSSGTISFGSGGNNWSPNTNPYPIASYSNHNFISFGWYIPPYNVLNGVPTYYYADFTNQNINYFVNGTAPNRVLVVNFKNIVLPTFYNMPILTINVQIQLYEGSEGKIEIHNTNNKSEVGEYGTGRFGKVGLQNADGSKGISVVNNSSFGSSKWDLSGTMVRLIYTPTIPPPTISANTSTTICEGGSITLNAAGCPASGTVTWNPGGATGASLPLTGLSADIVNKTQKIYPYSATCTVNGFTSAASAITNITIKYMPDAPLVALDLDNVYPYTTIKLTATGESGATYAWDWAGGTSSANPLNTSPATTTTYNVAQTLNGCTSAKASKIVNVKLPVSITILSSTPNVICSNGNTFDVQIQADNYLSPTRFTALLRRIRFSEGNPIYEPIGSGYVDGISPSTIQITNINSDALNSSFIYDISVYSQNPSSSATYGVSVKPGPIITSPNSRIITALNQPFSMLLVTSTTLAKEWYFTIFGKYPVKIEGETSENINVSVNKTGSYSLKLTDPTECSNVSNLIDVKVQFTLSGTSGTAAGININNVYTEGAMKFGLSNMCGGGFGYRIPQNSNASINYYDAGTHFYSINGIANDGCGGVNGIFIFRENNIWGIYNHYVTASGPNSTFNFVRLYHTKNPFPTSPGARVAANINTAPPASAVWINDATGEEVSLTLTGASETQTVLPLNLISFQGRQTASDENTLTWQTANETAFDRFEVQKSGDAKTFAKIGEVKGNRSEHYQFVDNSINSNMKAQNLPEIGSFYRLKMNDLDGKYTYSKIVSVAKKTENEITVFPNPATDFITINSVENIKLVRLMNSLGQVLLEKTGDKLNEINVKNIASGIYFIQISTQSNATNYSKILIGK